ncbi:hypothetical protein [Curtobacterium sp. VKM Ac-2884]|uniref:hypothetical protein n=1 Tax=Curtobacterium sp. VKM Ac-2884 TaxID=2783818 RepID=UPI00188D4E1A|nr:hypothetical protein [Curtobacterium sp. VKM Ac-2884]MBF4603771.1 hypothetical protein [Curtobacterium sp. VKM Ac-2884]
MPSIDVTNAPDRFLNMSVDGYSPGHNRPGNCARWTYFAINAIPNFSPLPSAIAAWNNAAMKHRHAIVDGKTRIPRGMVVALGALGGPRWPGDVNYVYGDVVVATGEGVGYDSIVIATDSLAGAGRIGRMTIRQRIAQTGRPLLGFLSSYGGWQLTSLTAAASTDLSVSTPIIRSTTKHEDDDIMRFTVEYDDPAKKTGKHVTFWVGGRSIMLAPLKHGSKTYSVDAQIKILRLWNTATSGSAATLTTTQRQIVQKLTRRLK